MSIQISVLRDIGRLTDMTDFSDRHIAKIVHVAPNTVGFYRKRFQVVNLNWLVIQELDDMELLSRLRLKRKRSVKKVMPDWKQIYERLAKNKHMTLELLHEEYRAAHKERAYSYSQFTYYYRKFVKKMDISMRLRRYPAEVMFVDFAGTLIPWQDDETGEKQFAQVFVAVLGFSSYIFACATRSQKLADFIEAHVKAFQFFGGAPESVVPDNLKSAVTLPGADPTINRSYKEMAQYHQTEVLPARPRKPKDKGLAEQAVRFVSRWISAKLLERTFFSLDEINEAIQEHLPAVNERKMRNYEGTRRSRFEEFEKPKLRQLPSHPYQYGEWLCGQKVPNDYHIKVFDHWYSVPHTLVAERVESRVSHNTVEIFHHNKRVAIHVRSFEVGGFTTDKTHFSPQHFAYADQGYAHYLDWAKEFGPATQKVVQAQYAGKRENSMVANKACNALKSVAKTYDKREFEAACARAHSIASPTLKSVKSILRTGLFKLTDSQASTQIPLPLHENVRGSSYYQLGGV